MARPKKKKPNYKKAETYQDYKAAAARFQDFNPQSDTLFVGTSVDMGMAGKKAQHQANVSASKGASSAMPTDDKTFLTKNEAGQDVFVNVRKYPKSKISQYNMMTVNGKSRPTRK